MIGSVCFFQSFARLVDLQRLKNVKVDPMSVKVGHPCSSSCASLCTSTVTSEFLGSNHSVVSTAVKASSTQEDLGVPKCNIGKADWQKFSEACDHTLCSFSIALDYAYCLFETSAREAALEAIPQSKGSIKIAVPWWNKQCDIAVKNKKHAFNRMKGDLAFCF